MFYMILYVMIMAVSTVLIHQLGVQLPTGLVLCLTAIYAILFFHLLNYKNLFEIYLKALTAKKNVLIMQLSVVFMWAGGFYVTIHYGPALHIFAYMCIISLYGQLASSIKDRQISDIVKSLFILAILLTFYVFCFSQFTLLNFLILLPATLITASSFYIYMVYSNQMTQLQYATTEVLALRYWMLFLAGLLLVLKNHEYTYISFSVLFETLGLSFLLLILPIFFLQKAIEKIGPYLCAVLMGTTPFVTFLLEKATIGGGDLRLAFLSIALAAVIMAPYFFSRYLRLKQARKRLEEIKTMIPLEVGLLE